MSAFKKDFYFDVNNETLVGTIDYISPDRPQPTALSLHGGGPHNRQLISYLSQDLNSLGLSLLRFDFSGHKDSTGLLQESSLEKRFTEALAASKFLNLSGNITLIATSMGGHIALELLPHVPVNKLILFCPAAYSHEAYSIPFGNGFSEIIRAPNSYLNTSVFRNLSKYNGDIMIIIGDRDEIIPPEVIRLYDQNSINARNKKIITVPNAPHSIHVWLQKNQHELEKILEEIKMFMKL